MMKIKGIDKNCYQNICLYFWEYILQSLAPEKVLTCELFFRFISNIELFTSSKKKTENIVCLKSKQFELSACIIKNKNAS